MLIIDCDKPVVKADDRRATTMIGLTQIAVLPLQHLDPLAFIRRRAKMNAGVALGLAKPVPSVQPIFASIVAVAAHCEA